MAIPGEHPEVAEARANIGRAVSEFLRLQNQHGTLVTSDDEDYPSQPDGANFSRAPYCTAWALFATYISPELEREGAVGNKVIVPESQEPAHSLGLFHRGVKAFE